MGYSQILSFYFVPTPTLFHSNDASLKTYQIDLINQMGSHLKILKTTILKQKFYSFSFRISVGNVLLKNSKQNRKTSRILFELCPLVQELRIFWSFIGWCPARISKLNIEVYITVLYPETKNLTLMLKRPSFNFSSQVSMCIQMPVLLHMPFRSPWPSLPVIPLDNYSILQGPAQETLPSGLGAPSRMLVLPYCNRTSDSPNLVPWMSVDKLSSC